jgi:hypothetical protein
MQVVAPNQLLKSPHLLRTPTLSGLSEKVCCSGEMTFAAAPDAPSQPVSSLEAVTNPTGALQRGRPSRFTSQIAGSICALVHCEGISDTQAGLLLGVPKATLSRWKAADEEFAFQLDQARAFFQREHVQRVLAARRPDGAPDWRASAWLLQRMFPEQYGNAARKAIVAEPPAAPDEQHDEADQISSISSEILREPADTLALPTSAELPSAPAHEETGRSGSISSEIAQDDAGDLYSYSSAEKPLDLLPEEVRRFGSESSEIPKPSSNASSPYTSQSLAHPRKGSISSEILSEPSDASRTRSLSGVTEPELFELKASLPSTSRH